MNAESTGDSKLKRDVVYEFIIEYKKTHDGNSPSIRQICLACGVNSTSNVVMHLRKLEKLGKLKMSVAAGLRGARNIEVVGGSWSLTETSPAEQ